MTSKAITKRSTKVEDKILRRLSKGESLTSICRDNDMPSVSAVQNWRRRDTEFDDLINRARRAGAWALFDQAMDDIDTCRTDQVQLLRERMIHRRWCMSKLAPEEFGDRSKVEMFGSVEHQQVIIGWQSEEDVCPKCGFDRTQSSVIDHDEQA